MQKKKAEDEEHEPVDARDSVYGEIVTPISQSYSREDVEKASGLVCSGGWGRARLIGGDKAPYLTAV